MLSLNKACKTVRNITNGFNGTETKADAALKKDDAKEDKENGRIVLPPTPTTTVVSTFPFYTKVVRYSF